MKHDISRTSEMTIGVDLGDRWSHFSVLDADGVEIRRDRVRMTPRHFRELFTSFAPCRVAMEVGPQSPWASRLVESCGHEVIVANPRQVHLISGSNNKHDQVDPGLLARLARVDPQLLRPIRHRSLRAQADLAVIRSRDALVRSRTALVNHVRGSVKAMGERIPSGVTAAALPKRARSHLPGELVDALEPVLRTLSMLTTQIKELTRQIENRCRERYPETERLRQVDGVGPITALTFVLTIEDPDRFARSREVAPYLGLVPRRYASGRRDPELSITKAGDKHLRRLLVQCAQYILGPLAKESDLGRWGHELAARGKKNAKKRAVVAVARKLAVLLHALWRSEEDYEPLRNRGADRDAA